MTYATTQKFMLHFSASGACRTCRDWRISAKGTWRPRPLAQLEPPLPQDGLFAGLDGELTGENDGERR